MLEVDSFCPLRRSMLSLRRYLTTRYNRGSCEAPCVPRRSYITTTLWPLPGTTQPYMQGMLVFDEERFSFRITHSLLPPFLTVEATVKWFHRAEAE